MPSVGMRRTTRVFGVVKAADGARVLRSGRRIWPNVDEPKVKRAHEVVDRDWNCLSKNPSKGKGNKFSGRSNGGGSKPSSPREVTTEKDEKEENFQVRKPMNVRNETVDKMFGIVYSRKRKRLSDQSSNRPAEPLRSLKFYCRRRRLSNQVSSGRFYGPVITLTVDGTCEECWLLSVFGLVMRYLRREHLRLSSLASFFLSQPIIDVFADHGVRFLPEAPLSPRGVCKFFGAMNCLPLFSADYAAIPRYFMDMHFTLLLRVAPHSFSFVKKSMYLLNNPLEESDSESESVLSEPCNPKNGGGVGLHPSVRASKLTVGNAQYRGNLGFHSIQKRRSSLRRRRERNLSHSVHKLYNGTSVSELSGSWKNRTAAASSRKLRSSVLNNSSPGSNGISIFPKPKSKEELDSLCCSANILKIHSDRCCREEGFSVMLELSSSKEWFVVIKKDGAVRYSHKARKTMRPCSCNRFTHSIVWIGDNDWKLEFCERQDWLSFKEIYNECYERNILEQNAKVIPIPGVREVCGYAEDIDDCPSFSMPASYISVKEDEVSRALARSTAIYDMDSEDEEWLERKNKEMLGEEHERSQQLQQQTFELMIDGFEKCYFHSCADDLLDGKAAAIASLSYLGKHEVVEAVHDYWARKRKQRKAPLLRVFQGHQAKKTPVLIKPVFRKRRSFKRQGSQLHGKSKQLSLVAIKSAYQDASAEKNVFRKVEEAKALADTSMEIAIGKRRRAQVLAENADLAVYKAMMALRIAEAMEVAESSEVATSLFLN